MGGVGTILATTNGGITWTTVNAPSLLLNGISCPSASTCFGMGDGGAILATTNGGSTWTRQGSNVTSARLTGVSCPSASACFVVGDVGTILATIDGGNKWTRQNSGTVAGLVGISCPSARICLAMGGAGEIVATTNAGRTWLTQSSGMVALNGISCPSARTCFAAGGAGGIVATTDGGRTWMTQPSGTTSHLTAISCPSASTCFVVGDGGTILATTNGGSSWLAETHGTGVNQTGISCPSTTNCFAVNRGDSGCFGFHCTRSIVLATSDGGGIWTTQDAPYVGAAGISCPSASTCFAVGGNNAGLSILATTNGGSSWTDHIAATRGFLAVSCQSTTCRAVGGGGTIIANHNVPAQPAGRGFGLSAGPLLVLHSALLSWTAGTQQSGYQILRFAAQSGRLRVLPAGGSPLPAPAQSYQDTHTLTEFLYCYTLVPKNGAVTLGTSDPVCLAPHTHSASGAPPSFTLRLNQSTTASLTWTAPGGQDGYVLLALAAGGWRRSQFLSGSATAATDDTAGQPTCYVLLPAASGAVLGNSDALCGIPGAATVAGPPALAPGLSQGAATWRQAVAGLPDVRQLLPKGSLPGRPGAPQDGRPSAP